MIYLYSGASAPRGDQTDSSLSLGGFISNSPIPNDLLQNIFSPASYLSTQANKRETKLIVLKNDDSTKSATAITLDFALNADTLAKYQIAFVAVDSDNDAFERISDPSARPFNAVFNPVVPGNPFTLPDMPARSLLGMWIMRSYDQTSADLTPKTCADFLTLLNTVPPPVVNIEDTLDLILNYTLV